MKLISLALASLLAVTSSFFPSSAASSPTPYPALKYGGRIDPKIHLSFLYTPEYAEKMRERMEKEGTESIAVVIVDTETGEVLDTIIF